MYIGYLRHDIVSIQTLKNGLYSSGLCNGNEYIVCSSVGVSSCSAVAIVLLKR